MVLSVSRSLFWLRGRIRVWHLLLPNLFFAGQELIQVLICARWGLMAVSKHTDAASARVAVFRHYDRRSVPEDLFLRPPWHPSSLPLQSCQPPSFPWMGPLSGCGPGPFCFLMIVRSDDNRNRMSVLDHVNRFYYPNRLRTGSCLD